MRSIDRRQWNYLSAPSVFGLVLGLSRPLLVVDASNADWNIGNNIFHPVVNGGGAGAPLERLAQGIENRQACLRIGGVWTASAEADFQTYPNWIVQLLFALVFLLSATLFTTFYLVWICFRRRDFSMHVRYNVEQSDKANLLSPSSPSTICYTSWLFCVYRALRRFRPPTSRRGIFIVLALVGVTLLVTAYCASSSQQAFFIQANHDYYSKIPPQVYYCKLPPNVSEKTDRDKQTGFSAKMMTEEKILVLVETPFSPGGLSISALLEANRFHFRVEPIRNHIPQLTLGAGTRGRYAVIVFENLHSYLRLNKRNRELLDRYCQQYGAGIILFSPPAEETVFDSPLIGIPDLTYSTNVRVKDVKLHAESPVLRILKPGQVISGKLTAIDWTTFDTNNDPTFVPIVKAFKSTDADESSEEGRPNRTVSVVTAMQDTGEKDGVPRIFFGHGVASLWLHRILFLDAIYFLSQGRVAISLDRYIQVDIDDIFVGKIRMTAPDVEALVEAQRDIQKTVPNFKFVLGFSGKMFHRGSDAENSGDDRLLSRADEFLWFGHMWKHQQAHKMNVSSLLQEMDKNLRFAQDHDIPMLFPYSVAPHHSGVFPVHEPLYQAWKKVWGIQVTSTEEYPHQKPAFRRKGFIHRDIQVLPRQTCGLWTHTYLLEKYPKGPAEFYRSIEGGELFQTIVFNPINIFMTHMSNYARDRLAPVTFKSVVNFISCWTNINLKWAPPTELARKYFDLFPEEKDPIWRDPCSDPKHREIWSSEKECGRLPDFVIVGPQKTGTTALHWFLSLHPKIFSSMKSSETFEEVQFFIGKNYFRGVDWYMDFFPNINRSSGEVVFEKSANYFDQESVPPRLSALLPNSRVVVIILSATKRAYSWYQHMRAHNDPAAMKFTFHEVVTGTPSPNNPLNKTTKRGLRDLRKHCLEPGYYAQHLARWLSYKQSQKILVIDGEKLKTEPFGVMNRVQDFLDIDKIDYSRLIKFDKNKGFFCQIQDERRTVCLGKGKGRRYPPMGLHTHDFLQRHYQPHNLALVKLLELKGYAIPEWLEDDLLTPAET